MSIKQQIEIKELRERVDALEMKINLINTTPRTVAGVPDPDPRPAPRKRLKKSEV